MDEPHYSELTFPQNYFKDIGQYGYFSLITLTTIGYGELHPVGNLRWVAGLEGLLGVILMSSYLVAAVRKFFR